MTDKEIKLKCVELATEVQKFNTLELAKSYFNWIADNKITVTGGELTEAFTRTSNPNKL